MLGYVTSVQELCVVLGMDFYQIVTDVHPSLDDSNGGHSKSISNDTLDRLAKTIRSLQDEKKKRIKKVRFFLDNSFPGSPPYFSVHAYSTQFRSNTNTQLGFKSCLFFSDRWGVYLPIFRRKCKNTMEIRRHFISERC